MTYDYHVVDVFTQTALEGNALAVIPDARGLETPTMQRIAKEFNLSETTFVLPAESGNAAAVRIFTPWSEMEFAGHPTIGTAYVLRKLGIVDPAATSFNLEERVGPVAVRVDSGTDPILWLTTPPIGRGETFDSARCAQALGLDPSDVLPDVPCRLLSAGNPNVYVPLKSVEAVDRIRIDSSRVRELFKAQTQPTCLFAFAPTEYGAYSRMFAEELGVLEDPATGSATGPLALFMMDHGLVSSADGTRFISEQGTKMGRRSILHVAISGEHGAKAIEVGGNVVPVATGTLSL